MKLLFALLAVATLMVGSNRTTQTTAPGADDATEEDTAPYELTLFYSGLQLDVGRKFGGAEFVVKVSSSGDEPLSFIYGSDVSDIRIPQEQFPSRLVRNRPDEWHLEIMTEPLDRGEWALNLSGHHEVSRTRTLEPGKSVLCGFDIPGNRIAPGRKVRVWAELLSPGPDGPAYRSQAIMMFRGDDAAEAISD